MFFCNITEDRLIEIVHYIVSQNKENIFLIGEVGAGKTRVAREICKIFGSEYVLSPTFTLVNIYEGLDKRVYHIDLYRLKSTQEVYEIGIDEILSYKDCIKIVEWADLFPDIIKNGLSVEIKIKDENTRDFFIKEV